MCEINSKLTIKTPERCRSEKPIRKPILAIFYEIFNSTEEQNINLAQNNLDI